MSRLFDPNSAAGPDSGVFGLPYCEEEAALVYLPVPWEATTSYGGGTSLGPRAILQASHQVDLFDPDVLKPYEAGLYFAPIPTEIESLNVRAKARAGLLIDAGGLLDGNAELAHAAAEVDEWSEKVNAFVYEATRSYLKKGKIVGVVGGDHAVPYGAIKAIAESHPGVGVLHFDAHSDTRLCYEGFKWSHASIMRNVLESAPGVHKIVQVGIRDFCEEEFEFCLAQKDRVKVFYDRDLTLQKFQGIPWKQTAEEIVKHLPKEVWVSFDIDGLDPRYCPNTGTPVPGGLDFHQANYVLETLARSGRKILGFDLNEVSPGEDGSATWDGNVGARLLYKLTAWTLASQGKAKLR